MRFLKIAGPILLALVLLWGFYQIFTLNAKVISLEDKLQETKETLTTRHENLERQYALIYLIKSEPTNFLLVPVKRQIAGEVTPATALQALLNGPLASEDLAESVPHTTRILGLDIQEGSARANFSREIVDDFNGGSIIEALLVEAIVNTLTEFPQIKKVHILVEGREIESIGGHVLIQGPLQRHR